MTTGPTNVVHATPLTILLPTTTRIKKDLNDKLIIILLKGLNSSNYLKKSTSPLKFQQSNTPLPPPLYSIPVHDNPPTNPEVQQQLVCPQKLRFGELQFPPLSSSVVLRIFAIHPNLRAFRCRQKRLKKKTLRFCEPWKETWGEGRSSVLYVPYDRSRCVSGKASIRRVMDAWTDGLQVPA